MNIFFLYYNPVQAARAHCDVHCHKMILESAQMLSTATRELFGNHPKLYKSTHINHPCTQLLARDDILGIAARQYVYKLCYELDEIRATCLGARDVHASMEVIKIAASLDDVDWDDVINANPDWEFNYPWPVQAMPERFRNPTYPSIAYMNYYNYKAFCWKNGFAGKGPMTWTNRPVPAFISPSNV